MIAIPHEEYPDTYNLFEGSVEKGYAAVQELDLSCALKAASKQHKKLIVEVHWNKEFSMYEIISLLSAE
jgi:hypothetical protein